MKILNNWEIVESSDGTTIFTRIQLPHGWIIRTLYSDGKGSITFVPKCGRAGW